MAKRNRNRRRAAFSAIGLLVETGCGVFTLFLASRDASYSQALAAKQWLAALIAQRVRAYVEQLGSLQVGESAHTADGDLLMPPLDVEWMVGHATARVMAALPRCASRSVVDFERWLERQIADAVDEDPDGNPPCPGTPAVAAQVSASWALHRLPIPRAQRAALVAAVLAALMPPERDILEAMQDPNTSWVDVASRFGLSMFAAKRLYRHADDRAHEIAVRLAAQAAGVPATPVHVAAA